MMGGVRNVFGKHWQKLTIEEKTLIEDNVLSNAITDSDELAINKVKKVLVDGFNCTEKSCRKLYHHSDKRQKALTKPSNLVQAVQSIKNPIVQAALFEVNGLVPQIIDEFKEYGKIDEIKIEMARELKKSAKQRKEDRFRNWENERENDACRAELDKLGLTHTRDNIQRMWLWRECKHICPYSGREIGLEKLFKEGSWQIEHIIPYSISLDDSLANKTLCEAGMNKTKGQRTPWEAFNDSPEWEKMISRAYKLLPYHKAQRFVAKKHADLDDFIQSQLNDTRYIARESKNIVEKYVPKVSITQGGLTAMLRQHWGLNGILNHRYKLNSSLPEGEYFVATNAQDEILEDHIIRWHNDYKERKKIQDELKKHGRVLRGNVKGEYFFPSKSRDDHRHHAIDAIAVACTKTRFLQEASRLRGKGLDGAQMLGKVDEPWEGFWHQAKNKVEGILVSYKNRKRTLTKVSKPLYDKQTGKAIIKDGKKWKGQGIAARGELHKATYYGNYVHSDEQEYLHERVDLDTCRTRAQIMQIVDDGVREAVLKRLTDVGVDIHHPKFKAPDDTAENPVYFRKDAEGRKIPLVFLPNQNGAPVPIKKVRIYFSSSNKVQLHGVNRFVEPGNNHHVIIFEDENGKWQEEVVTFWQVLERKKQKLPTYQLPAGGKKIITVLQINHLFLLGLSEDAIDWNKPDMEVLSERLYRVQTTSENDYRFRRHNASTLEYNIDMKRVSLKSLKELAPIKVRIDRTGKLIRI
jgi:CRISPR-associated endonuclease Csn1